MVERVSMGRLNLSAHLGLSDDLPAKGGFDSSIGELPAAIAPRLDCCHGLRAMLCWPVRRRDDLMESSNEQV